MPPGYGYQLPPPPKKKGWGALKITLLVVGVVLLVCVGGSLLATLGGGDNNRVKTTPPAAKAGTTAEPEEGVPADDAEEPAKDAPDAANFNVKVGTTMTVTSSGSVQEATIKSVKIHKGACGGFGADPDNGSYLIVDVLVSQKTGTGSVNPLFFTFVGDDGTTADSLAGAFSGCTKNDLGSTNSLRAGSKRSGQIAFDVKNGKGSIEFTPDGLGGDALGSWKAG